MPEGSRVSKIPVDTQRKVLWLYRRNVSPSLISREVNLRTSAVLAIVEHGSVQPRNSSKAYRCKGCGMKVLTDPCLICESKNKN